MIVPWLSSSRPAKGSEADWAGFADGRPFPTALDLLRCAAFGDAELTPFFGRGGKLLTSIGWNDYHNPDELIGYGRSPIGNAGPQARDAVRLFTVPGMGHCFGRLGCDTFDKLGILDAWLDWNIVTKRAITSKVSKGRVVRNRPLCAVPRVARYDGSGDLDDAKNFACAEP